MYAGNRDHKLHLLVGGGGNGKGVLIGAIGHALGDYAEAGPASVLNGSGNEHPTGLAKITAARLAFFAEINDKAFREEVLKALTGGDVMSVRFMRQDFFDILPECTCWGLSNAPPSLKSVDKAIRRRIWIWPFNFEPTVVNTRLSELMARPDVLGAWLEWMVEGAALYYPLPALPQCKLVEDATAEYLRTYDTFANWRDDCTEFAITTDRDTLASTLYRHYGQWCAQNGFEPISSSAFTTQLGGYVKRSGWAHRTRHGRGGSLYPLAITGSGDTP